MKDLILRNSSQPDDLLNTIQEGLNNALKNNLIGMMQSNLLKINNYEKSLNVIEEILLNEQQIRSISDWKDLIFLFEFVEQRQINKQNFILKLIDASQKNKILSNLISSVIEAKEEKSPGEVDPKIQKVVNMIKKTGLDKIHSPLSRED